MDWIRFLPESQNDKEKNVLKWIWLLLKHTQCTAFSYFMESWLAGPQNLKGQEGNFWIFGAVQFTLFQPRPGGHILPIPLLCAPWFLDLPTALSFQEENIVCVWTIQNSCCDSTRKKWTWNKQGVHGKTVWLICNIRSSTVTLSGIFFARNFTAQNTW